MKHITTERINEREIEYQMERIPDITIGELVKNKVRKINNTKAFELGIKRIEKRNNDKYVRKKMDTK